MIEFILGIRTPLSTTSMPASARMTSNRPGNFPSRSLIRNCARQPASSKSITRFLAAYATQDAAGWAVAPRILILRLACSITANTCSRTPDRVTVSKKSQASRAPAWERRKSAHVVELRSGAGSIPASCRISQTVEAATLPQAPAARRAPGDTPSRDSRGPAATPGRGSSARCAAGPGAGAGTAGRAGVRPDRGASGARYPGAPPSAVPQARPSGAGAAAPPATPDHPG
jgi:hypothetical protein